MTKSELVSQIEQEKLVVIVRGIPTESLTMLCEALYRGGIRFLELTFRPDGALSDEEVVANIKRLSETFDGKLTIGAGTVLKPEQVKAVRKAGGRFIVSPNTDLRVIRATKKAGLVSIPGALTPSEIMTAYNAGADFVKVFPANALGADYVKALRAPMPHVKMLAVGGITLDDIPSYQKAGVCGFAVGGALANKTMVAKNDYEAIEQNAKAYVTAVKNGL